MLEWLKWLYGKKKKKDSGSPNTSNLSLIHYDLSKNVYNDFIKKKLTLGKDQIDRKSKK